VAEPTALADRLSARRLDADLAAAAVQVGVSRGWWTIKEVAYPFLVVSLAAASQTHAPGRVALRFDALGYPDIPATGCPWDPIAGTPLAPDCRPTGGRATLTFRGDWEGGRALYLPCDRIAIIGHPGWVVAHPHDLWSPVEGIAKYLRLVHTILTEADDADQINAA
jgi:hypothetical protein